jgi:hypothetical protein
MTDDPPSGSRAIRALLASQSTIIFIDADGESRYEISIPVTIAARERDAPRLQRGAALLHRQASHAE